MPQETAQGRMMDDIDLLPPELRNHSLSDQEIVLPYHEALQALEVLVEARWALLGWEGWVRYADGKHGHAPNGMGTTSIEQELGETWEAYVQRSADFCRQTMGEEQKLWETDPKHVSMTLSFCLTAIKQDG